MWSCRGAIFVIQQAGLNGLIPPIGKQDFIATLCGVASCLFLFQFMRPMRFLAAIGRHSYTVIFGMFFLPRLSEWL